MKTGGSEVGRATERHTMIRSTFLFVSDSFPFYFSQITDKLFPRLNLYSLTMYLAEWNFPPKMRKKYEKKRKQNDG